MLGVVAAVTNLTRREDDHLREVPDASLPALRVAMVTGSHQTVQVTD